MKSKTIAVIVLCAAGGFLLGAFYQEKKELPLTRDLVAAAEQLFGLQFNAAKRDSMLDDLNDNLASYRKLRELHLNNSVPPAFDFNPVPVGMKFETQRKPFVMSAAKKLTVPAHLDELAFASIGELAELLRARKVTSTQLTQMYLARLKKYGPRLECVITLTEELALKQAARADAEIAAGKYRGPLHGIPYGAKDLLAAKGYKTTWGSVPYQEQMLEQDATVIQRLEAAGAVLVAKLTLGELAWGEVWFGGKTRNPWNLEQGSSGSSAGSASATAAGLVAFALGSETYGSIVSPSTRCGVTGLRPTYGRVSRAGAMALSWTMDKLGPICRTVEDCALVFNAIYGPDGFDQTVVDLPFNYNPKLRLNALRIGYLQKDFASDSTLRVTNEAALAKLRELGAQLIPIELPKLPVEAMNITLSAEAAAAFDELTLSGKDDLLVRQIKNAWPNAFRSARFIPAVEFIQAHRARYLLVQEMGKLMSEVDIYVAPSFGGNNLLLTNLSGHPCVVVPNGFNAKGSPVSLTFVGKLYDEATLLAVAKIYQDATEFHLKHPAMNF